MNITKVWIGKIVILLIAMGALSAGNDSRASDCPVDLSFHVEGDVFPYIPGGLLRGDGIVTMNDWIAVADFVTGLTAPIEECQFILADCAPRVTLGEGVITVIDFVQAFRYSFFYSLGFDTPTSGGGPAAPTLTPTPRQPGIGSRSISASGSLVRGADNVVTVYAQAAGDEFGVGFTLEFDASQLHLKTVEGADQTFFRANQLEATTGKMGIIVLHPGSQSEPFSPFPAGSHPLVNLTFTATGWTNLSTSLRFTDALAIREVSNTNAIPLETDFQDISLPFVGGGPHLTAAQITRDELHLVLSGDPGDYLIETSSDLIHWTSLVTVTNTSGVTPFTDSSATNADQRFYRAVPKP